MEEKFDIRADIYRYNSVKLFNDNVINILGNFKKWTKRNNIKH